MHDKIRLYCDLNTLDHTDRYQAFADILEKTSYEHCIARNTNDFLVHWIWQLQKGIIDDEAFFQIGDVWWTADIKVTRPHLDAIDQMLQNIQDNTLYVVDAAAQKAYEHAHWPQALSHVQKNLESHWSAIFAL